MDINKFSFDSEEAAKYLTVEACEKLAKEMRLFEDAVKALWWYVIDNKTTNTELPEELFEHWQDIKMYVEDNAFKIDVLSNPNKIEAWLALHKFFNKPFNELTAEERAEHDKLQAILESDNR